MKIKRILTISLLIYTTFFMSCGSNEPITKALLPPLDWIKIGSPRKKIILHLPISFSKSKISKFFVSLIDIKESGYKKSGLKDVYLFFKKVDDTIILNAAQMIFINNPVIVKKIRKKLLKQFGKSLGRKWVYRKKLYIDIDKTHPKNCKVTYEIR